MFYKKRKKKNKRVVSSVYMFLNTFCDLNLFLPSYLSHKKIRDYISFLSS